MKSLTSQSRLDVLPTTLAEHKKYTTAEILERGHQASLLISNQLLKETMAYIKSECMDRMFTLPARDVEGREQLFRQCVATDKVYEMLQVIINDAKMKGIELEALQKNKKKGS